MIKSDEMYHLHMKEIKDFFSNLASKRKEWYTKIVFDYDDEYHDLIIEMGEDFSRFIQKLIANEILNKKEKIKELDKDFTLSIAKKTAEEQRLNNTIDKLTERLASLNGIKKEYYKKVKEEFEDTFSLVKGNENLAERALRVLEALKN